MKYIYRGLLVCSLLLSGCSDDDIDIYEPDPLVDIENQFDINTLWSTNIGDGSLDNTVKIAPVFANGKIFVADNSGNVAAINPENGKRIWRTELDVQIGGGPSISNDLLVVGSQQGEVIVLNAKDGSIKWRKPAPSEIISHPAIGEGYVVVNTVDGKITAYDAITGEQKWFYDQSIPSLTLRGNSSPVIVGGAAISGFSNGKLVVFLLPNGRVAWEKTITAAIGRSEIQRLVDIDMRPQVFGTNIYVASYNGNLVNLDARNGESIWQRELSVFQELTISDLLLLVTHENSFVSGVNRDNGVILWTQKILHRRMLTAPVVVGDNVVVADFEGYVHWLSRSDGQVLSRKQIDSDGITAMPLVVGNKVIILGHGGTLYAIEKEQAIN